MTAHPPRPRRPRHGALVALGLILILAVVVAGPTAGQEPEEPTLDQQIEQDQAVATGDVVLADGHVDIGPRLVDDVFTLMVHDDAVVPSVWRHLEDTVLVVGDEAVRTVPDDPTYAFLGVAPGTDVHIVPQVQRPGVVWLGWNTQDPEVMERIDRGATLTLLGVQGPGEVTMYLQSGTLGEPEVLWRSTEPERQSIWVEVNTHTHANWVFTEPGTYLVQVEISADLVGGEAVSDVRTLRFAVGDDTDPGEARTAGYDQVVPPDGAGADEATEVSDEEAGASVAPLMLGIVGALVVLAVAAAAVAARGARAKRQAERERAAAGLGGSS